MTQGNQEFGKLFWFGLVCGWGVIAYGMWTLIHHASLTHPIYSLLLAFGANVVHDVIVAPAVFAVGFLVRRVVPPRWSGPILWGAYASGVVLLLAYAPLRGFGLREDNPSILPLDYTSATLTVLGTIWGIVAVVQLVRAVRRRQLRV